MVAGVGVYFIGWFLLFFYYGIKHRHPKLSSLFFIAGVTLVIEGILVVLLFRDPILELSSDALFTILLSPVVALVTKIFYDIWNSAKQLVKDFGLLRDLCPIFQKETKEKFREYIFKSHEVKSKHN